MRRTLLFFILFLALGRAKHHPASVFQKQFTKDLESFFQKFSTSGSSINQVPSENKGGPIDQNVGSLIFHNSRVVTGKGRLEKAFLALRGGVRTEACLQTRDCRFNAMQTTTWHFEWGFWVSVATGDCDSYKLDCLSRITGFYLQGGHYHDL